MTLVFLGGMLCDDALRQLVLGRHVAGQPARLHGWAVKDHAEGGFSVLVAQPLANPQPVAEGLVLSGLSPDEAARLDHFQAALGCQPVQVTLANGQAAVAHGAHHAGDGAFSLADWQARWAALAHLCAGDIMALQGTRKGADLARRLGPMMVRAASRLRAAHDTPATLRRAGQGDDALIADQRTPYANFFAVEEYDLSVRRFDGTRGPQVTRAAFVSGDAVTVLPYDPVLDRVLLVEQFRMGPMARGDRQVWQLEVIAGRVDPGETPEQAARREAVEEAGLTLGAMVPVAEYYPSPGAKTEFLYSFVALTDLPDGSAGTYGLAEEAEDIRGHLISFDRLMDLVASGEVANAPLILTALWLQRERAALQQAARHQA